MINNEDFKFLDDAIEKLKLVLSRLNKWAEIIPEEEKKEELIILEHVHNKFVGDNFKALKELVDKHNADKPEISDYELQQIDRHIKKIDQSLHDQIREGGWKKVFDLAGDEYDPAFQPGQLHKCDNKLKPYIRLLALSKVLNESISTCANRRYTVCIGDNGLTVDYNDPPYCSSGIRFNDWGNAKFSIDFAEKEWKIFYNTEK